MQKSRFGQSGYRQRRFVLLLALQLIAVWLVISVYHQLSTDVESVSRWLPHKLDDPADSETDAKADGAETIPRSRARAERESGELDEKTFMNNLFTLIPYYNDLSMSLEKSNHAPPRNLDLFPKLADDHITIVLYVHNRPQYLRLVVNSLSQVEGIEETLLVVSHDGFFPEMNLIIEEIDFCQVKPIFATFSPHLFPSSFPGQAPGDCVDKEDAAERGCSGNPDQFGNHRAPRIVSLKHHWWWMMNTVWDGLAETRDTTGHILFIEEDHLILPDAYRTIQQLSRIVGTKCPECVAVNLAPVDVSSRGEGFAILIVEKVGNVGYAFNRTVWNWIHAMAKPFCLFDDYNWDITMWAVVYPSFPAAGYTLRGPRASAVHFGKCGLHQGQDKTKGLCIDENEELPRISSDDAVPYLSADWRVSKYAIHGYDKGFGGWGGWGDRRDRDLCQSFSVMYHRSHSV